MFPAFFSSHLGVYVSVGLLSLAGLSIVYVVTRLCEAASDIFGQLDRPAPKGLSELDGSSVFHSDEARDGYEQFQSILARLATTPEPPRAPGLEPDRQRLDTLVKFDEYRRRIL